ncbi:unnamed protein product [Rodentolepis nana]|uniref:MARVEL domain-containing protein n=1 Tax=Rodentolepis nana TaxID=102285 RepID=A0A0R3T2C8_RODNA|nr:unnamed protein product [Rodentolepis nana]
MDILTLTVPLTCISIGLTVTSLVLPNWNCGGFFTTCVFTLVHLIVMVLILSGLFLISIIFITEMFGACRPSWMPGPFCGTIKILVSTIGAGSLMAGNVFYAFMFVQSWSFLLSFSGAIVAVHVVLFSMFGSKCFKNN